MTVNASLDLARVIYKSVHSQRHAHECKARTHGSYIYLHSIQPTSNLFAIIEGNV